MIQTSLQKNTSQKSFWSYIMAQINGDTTDETLAKQTYIPNITPKTATSV